MPTDRRQFLTYCSTLGLGTTLLPGVLWSRLADGADITVETIACAEEIAGISLSPEQRAMMVENLRRQQRAQQALHAIPLDNSVAPALHFDPLPPGRQLPARLQDGALTGADGRAVSRTRTAIAPTMSASGPAPSRSPLRAMPPTLDELAFEPVATLAELVRNRKVTSRALTDMYLRRIDRYDPQLHAVVTVMAVRARTHATAADEEIARGRYRGPLHGIPWGAKDLLATRGHPTTWGSGAHRTQQIEEDATVVRRLDDAGAVLVAKLTMGELAMGDVWFSGTTRNPWYPEQGSSGSSAGPGSAVAAGLVPFAIGTETLGSISSPATRNGVTGLRPTFGRVPRTGAMALSWSMDKIGPMCRTAEDCALVLAAIAGPDGVDRSVRDVPFTWDASLEWRTLRIGYFQRAFDAPERDPENPARIVRSGKAQDDAALAVLRGLGARLIAVEPPAVATQMVSLILQAEAAAAFEEITRTGRIDELVQQNSGAWPNTFRSARFIPAIDYINANRVRTGMLEEWWKLFEQVDVIVSPTGGTNQLTATNLTGNPAVILPHGFTEGPLLRPSVTPADSLAARQPRPQVPTSLTFLGGLYDEARLLAVAMAYQHATDWHLRRPPSFTNP
ncbi:MAG: amidase [Gemmatimonadaceae bacterium]|nr:amidase [Gemmatimonadaceae bacterium]